MIPTIPCRGLKASLGTLGSASRYELLRGGKTHTSAESLLNRALRSSDLPPMECGAGASRVSYLPACLGDGLSCELVTDGANELSTSAPWPRSAGFEPIWGASFCSYLSTDL